MKTLFIGIIIFFFSIFGCGNKESRYIDIDKDKLSSKQPIDTKKSEKEKPIMLALGSMTTPKEAYGYYHELVKYLEKKINIPINLADKDTYAETNKLFKEGKVDIGFVCGRPYVDGHDEFNLELLVAPQINGKVKYYSYIIVHKDSNVNKFEELRGKSFAFADPMSNSGRLVPIYLLSKELNETPEVFFKKYIYSGSHDNSISMVAGKIVDAAAVDSLIWDHLNAFDPKDTSKTRIIKISPPFGMPPVVVSPQLDKKLKSKFKQIFLTIHQDPEGKKILQKMRIEKFVEVPDSNYDDIREAKTWLKQHNIKE